MRWAGHVARMGIDKIHGLSGGKSEARKPLGRSRFFGRMTLKWIVKK
jgi:hypothetical protein